MKSDYFHKIDSEEKAYWLGFILGDGCLYRNEQNGNYTLQINLQYKDREHLEKFARAIDYGKELELTFPGGFKQVRLRVGNKEMFKDLLNLGLTPRKSLTAKWPKIPKKYEVHMLRGLFDADGCITHYYSNGNFDRQYAAFALLGTKNCLTNATRIFGMKWNIRVDGKIFRMSKKGNGVTLSIYKKLYKQASIYLDRKKEKFEELLQLNDIKI